MLSCKLFLLNAHFRSIFLPYDKRQGGRFLFTKQSRKFGDLILFFKEVIFKGWSKIFILYANFINAEFQWAPYDIGNVRGDCVCKNSQKHINCGQIVSLHKYGLVGTGAGDVIWRAHQLKCVLKRIENGFFRNRRRFNLLSNFLSTCRSMNNERSPSSSWRVWKRKTKLDLVSLHSRTHFSTAPFFQPIAPVNFVGGEQFIWMEINVTVSKKLTIWKPRTALEKLANRFSCLNAAVVFKTQRLEPYERCKLTWATCPATNSTATASLMARFHFWCSSCCSLLLQLPVMASYLWLCTHSESCGRWQITS